MSFRKGLAVGLGILALAVIVAWAFSNRWKRSKAPSVSVYAHTLPHDRLDLNFEQLANHVEPAVVNINTERFSQPSQVPERGPFADLFGNWSDPDSSSRTYLGAGFIVDPNGYILTTTDVIDKAAKISVKLSDGRILDAVVVGTDPKSNLAVLKIRGSNFPVLSLAGNDAAVGEWVAAFGSPFGLDQTMTAGIISARGRMVGTHSPDQMLQTDASINPGNSGGPLVNLHGDVVGVNTTAVIEPGFSGIGFAIPAGTAARVYKQLMKSGHVTRGWIGVRVQEVTPEIAKSFGLQSPAGALVADVIGGSPASRAGLSTGDVILAYNSEAILGTEDLSEKIINAQVGSTAKLTVLRNGKHLSLDITVGERPSSVAERFRSPGSHGALGIMVENLTPDIQSVLRLSSANGALVIEVEPGSPAAEGGVQAGDIIHSINHVEVDNVNDLLNVMHTLDPGSTVLLGVQRQGNLLYLAFDLS